MNTPPIRPGKVKLATGRARSSRNPTVSPMANGASTAEPDMLLAARQIDSPAHQRAALRTHVERTLLGFFGDRLALQPEFQEIVSQVAEAMSAEPSLLSAVQPLVHMGSDVGLPR